MMDLRVTSSLLFWCLLFLVPVLTEGSDKVKLVATDKNGEETDYLPQGTVVNLNCTYNVDPLYLNFYNGTDMNIFATNIMTGDQTVGPGFEKLVEFQASGDGWFSIYFEVPHCYKDEVIKCTVLDQGTNAYDDKRKFPIGNFQKPSMDGQICGQTILKQEDEFPLTCNMFGTLPAVTFTWSPGCNETSHGTIEDTSKCHLNETSTATCKMVEGTEMSVTCSAANQLGQDSCTIKIDRGTTTEVSTSPVGQTTTMTTELTTSDEETTTMTTELTTSDEETTTMTTKPTTNSIGDTTTVLKMCDSNTINGITWPKTPAGNKISLPCVDGATGEVSRKCSNEGEWETPNSDWCIDKEYEDILDEVTKIENGTGATINDTKKITEKLEDTVYGNDTSSSEPIKAGNLNASVEAALKLSFIHEDLENPPQNDEVMAIVEICSYLIEEKNMISWKKLLEVDDKRGTAIMTTLDNYAESLVKVVMGVPREENITVYTNNIVFSSDPWKPVVGPVKYPKINSTSWSNETMDYITIDNATLLGMLKELDASSLTISSTYYRTLDRIVPNRIDLHKDVYIGSKILAIEIANKSSAVQTKISMELYFQHNEDVDDGRVEANCTYWDFTLGNGGNWSTNGCQRVETDKHGTKCKCDHMTNFALLMSMYRPMGSMHTVLSIISIVGCSSSVICMIVTIVVHALLWKSLKMVQRGSSSRSMTTMALCAVLVVANIVFLAGVEQKKRLYKPLCITIAAVIHYLFLVAFGIMLSTGIQLYLKVSSLAHGMSTDNKNQVIGFLVAAFGIPLLIVGVTLAIVAPNHYISSEFCWLSLEKGIIFSFVGPIMLVLIINIVVTVLVIMKSVKSRTSGLRGGSEVDKRLEITKSTLWSIAVLTPIMGTTWIFGLFSVNEASVVFQFIFVILNSSQGVLIFVFSCLLDKSVLKARALNAKKKTHKPRQNTMETVLGSND